MIRYISKEQEIAETNDATTIRIKKSLKGWVPASFDEARKFAVHQLNTITTMSYEDTVNYINSQRLIGVTVQELDAVRDSKYRYKVKERFIERGIKNENYNTSN